MAERKLITDLEIRNLKPKGREYRIRPPATGAPSLYLRVTANGAKIFAYRYWNTEGRES